MFERAKYASLLQLRQNNATILLQDGAMMIALFRISCKKLACLAHSNITACSNLCEEGTSLS